MDKLKVKVILASIRDTRLGERVAQWVVEQAKLHPEVDVELLDLRSFELPMYHDAKEPSAMEGVYPDEAVTRWSQAVAAGDAFIIVTPEYNHGYPASLKNALDWLFPEWRDKPVALVGYSSTPGAGIRAVEQLRQVVANLEMVAIRLTLQFPLVSADKPFDGTSAVTPAARLMVQLVRMAKALKPLREQH